MNLIDVQTLKSSIYDFTIDDTKHAPVKDSIGFMSYGVNGKWLFDMNQTKKMQINLKDFDSDQKKLDSLYNVYGSKNFSAEYRNHADLFLTTKVDKLAIIELLDENDSPEIGMSIDFSTENGSPIILYQDKNGNSFSRKFRISEASNDKGFFSSSDFETVIQLLDLYNNLSECKAYVLEKKSDRIYISVSGTLEINILENQGIQDYDIGELKKDDKWNLSFCKKEIYTFELREKNRSKELNDLISNGQITLCQVMNISDTSLQVLIQQYANDRNKQLFFRNFPIKISKEYEKKIRDFDDEIYLNMNGKKYFVCQFADNNKNYVFTIFTKYSRIKVEKILAHGNRIDGNIYTLNVKSLEPRREKNIIPNLSLVEGTISFVDKDTEVDEEINHAIDSLIESKSSYLQTWDRYAELKGNEILARGRSFGILNYKSITFESDSKTNKKKVVLSLKESLPKNITITKTDSFDIYENLKEGENLPMYMKKENLSMTWKDYYKATVDDEEDKELLKDIRKLAGEKECRKDGRERYGDKAAVVALTPVTVYNGVEETRILEFYYNEKIKRDDFPESGHIVLSIYAEEIQIKRQEQARRMISSGSKSIMPKLRVLLEDQIENIPYERPYEHVELLPYFSQKIFGEYGPNERQLEAIYTALESRDIAVIQGPPGTGKTTVICAILEMYNFMRNKKSSNQGLYLLTSYQHDAVINLIDRLRLNGSPTFKFGRKNGQEENYEGNIIKYIEEMKENQIANYIKEKYGKKVSDITNSEYEKYSEEFYDSFDNGNDLCFDLLSEYYNNYCSNPSNYNKIIFLKKLKEIPSISFEDNKLIQSFINSAEKPMASEIYLPLLNYVRALRVEEISYKDDGIARTKELLQGHNKELIYEILEQIVPGEVEKYFTVLEDAANSINNAFKDFEELNKIQLLLLDFITEPPEYIKPRKDPQIVDLYKRISEGYKKKPKDEKTRILSDWVQALDFNSTGIIEAIKKSDVAYSATAQQSVGKDITEEKASDRYSKSIGSRKDNFSYDVVVIDEAARATPPDLLIPMSRGKEKIILVGDHRQLPHLVDPEIANKLLESEDADGSDEFLSENTSKRNLEYSMFQILFNHLKKIEANGGVKRVVTLNKQYRMHPTLGDFASNQFYRPYGEGFDSPRPKTDFAHSLTKIENKCAVWLDVPMSEDNKELRDGNSLMRPAEAKAIINQLLEWKTSVEGKDLTYGVITFYRAQADYIAKLATQNNELADCLEKGELRINTVDAFQGMEFDVVFLSVVRTCAGKDKERKYGFLTSKNRLCVALTRQKKVLVICGDTGLLKLDDAHDKENGIPELCAFYEELCNGEDGVCL